ncbi:ferritin-like domain-containing protein [Streptantibioticus ferralitis]|uniref:Ferritin-like domain-containing protein n=1 Tax=Streptantibioticus ferralitis TaxID=236510 RepID=A0ABT5YWX5_9ACTN|nr:ferritin-like domain-containing protein [Streptantibioticus ferralitis]MDF2256086.1 ferritin-like domain-containing protein [Streptantibioticus ferralitis]
MTLSENDLWLLSFYRSSEINGALFFGRVARTLRGGPLQADVTHHFADEANHAKYWTRCIEDLGYNAEKLSGAYQDQYLEAVGLPANLMEVMAITQVFEKRVIGQYHRHLRAPDTHPRVRQTIETIMEDERWHVKYVRDALQEMAQKYGQELIDDTLARFTAADEEVYAKTLAEYGERIVFLGDGPVDLSVPAAEV